MYITIRNENTNPSGQLQIVLREQTLWTLGRMQFYT